ncbi:hypothetical protein PtrSN001A_008721, partial [Pyrenophora tritici-repentis]
MKNNATTKPTYWPCRHGSPIQIFDSFRGGNRGLSTMHTNSINGIMINATIRIDQPKPSALEESEF